MVVLGVKENFLIFFGQQVPVSFKKCFYIVSAGLDMQSGFLYGIRDFDKQFPVFAEIALYRCSTAIMVP